MVVHLLRRPALLPRVDRQGGSHVPPVLLDNAVELHLRVDRRLLLAIGSRQGARAQAKIATACLVLIGFAASRS